MTFATPHQPAAPTAFPAQDHRPGLGVLAVLLLLAPMIAGAAAASDAGASASTAAQVLAPAVAVSAAWARATAPGIATGAIYLRIDNPGDADDRLLSATSPAAASVELHMHKMDPDGAMAMIRLDALDIPAHGSVTCAPGRYHLMLFGLTRQLVAGTQVPVTLQFARAGAVTVAADVGDIAAMGPPGADSAPGSTGTSSPAAGASSASGSSP